MHGGVKIYRGAATAARQYVEADRGRADDHYLAEGTGIAERLIGTPDSVERAPSLDGDAYEAWVAGLDPETHEPRGRLRKDARATRFAEVVVNGPKSWSLAAALHPEVAEAYDSAMDSAAHQIVAWLAEHATTRVGPRGRQVQVLVERIEAAVIRHYSSRAGDPHRHLHLQINARVFADGKWRGLHTVGMRDNIDAINGIGHAAVMCDPHFRRVLADHGFTVDPEAGEIDQLAEFVGPFSARARQIGRNIERYETEWRADHPGEEPGPGLLRSWDARAWADNRRDKVAARNGADITERWVHELAALDYRPPAARAPLHATRTGQIDRDRVCEIALTRLGAKRSAWNTADIRGVIEHLITEANVVTEVGVRAELAEDLTARVAARCLPLLKEPPPAEHIRSLTSPEVLEVEADLTTRLAARAIPAAASLDESAVGTDDAQLRKSVVALAGDSPLVVLEGAAGTGKTTALAAASDVIERRGHRLVLVAPTLKAAQVAGREVGAHATSAAMLARRCGWSWDEDGHWSRAGSGTSDALRPGDVLLIDEAGMLDQDTARALLTIADEAGAKIRLVGDRHQLPAVGRGGVLDLGVRWTRPEQHLSLESVRRFRDPAYADLSLAMRSGGEPADVFRKLHQRGEVVVHQSEEDRLTALAFEAVESSALIVADTREDAATLNAVIHDLRVEDGLVDEESTVATRGGDQIGRGDRVTTRANDYDQGVANRDTWTVVDIYTDGGLLLSGAGGERRVDSEYARKHVELAYATTAYGAQGETVDEAHLALTDRTGAASAYVGMTRGRERNAVHVVAEDLEDAEQQWVAAFTRDRADLGPAHAARLAAEEAVKYETPKRGAPRRRPRRPSRVQPQPATFPHSPESPSIGF
jgi:exodeoxyribonuclease V alpha subunit